MRRINIMVLALFSFSTASFAREPYVSLSNYVANAQAIFICTVELDNGDTTVTVRVDETLKGELDKTEVLQGETGHCVVVGPVSHFMKPKERYLVFLFDDNTVGRLGGILPVEEVASWTQLTDTLHHAAGRARRLAKAYGLALHWMSTAGLYVDRYRLRSSFDCCVKCENGEEVKWVEKNAVAGTQADLFQNLRHPQGREDSVNSMLQLFTSGAEAVRAKCPMQ